VSVRRLPVARVPDGGGCALHGAAAVRITIVGTVVDIVVIVVVVAFVTVIIVR